MSETRTILIADDEPHIAQVMALKLRNAGYTVFTASDGSEAMEIAACHHPDLVITDMQMPVLSGLELARKLRESEKTDSIPLIMVTARSHKLTPEDLEPTNIRAVLCKPFSPRELLVKVETILGTTPDGGISRAA